MTVRSSFLVWGSAATLLVAAGAIAPGLGQSQDQPPRPTFRTEINYVRVDVYPTLNGAAVTDLRQDEFEIFEDRVPQKIDQFEHITIRGNLAQELRREPSTVAESREMLADPRARVFVLFLDTLHVDLASSRTIRKPLVDTLNSVIGPDDLIGVMTPGMSALDVSFARRTTTIEGILDRYWWGERDRLDAVDETERLYRACYPPSPGDRASTSPVARAMIERRREKLTLDALEDLVVFLRGVREERKAILTITDGWRLFQPDSTLTRIINGQVPSVPPVGIDPRTGRLTTRDTTGLGMPSDCDRDRMLLAQIDHDQRFRELLDRANWANASFYPIDPRGLAVFDSPIGPDPPLPIPVDAAILRSRAATLRMFAEQTDGVAVVNTNDIAGALRRVVSDLSSYYLLGYYATNTKPDGRFRSIAVRVKRPGVQVRARRGYLAPTVAEITRTSSPGDASAETAAAAAEAHAIEAAVGSLAGLARELPLRLQAAAAWKSDKTGTIWAVGEIGSRENWKAGGEADITVIGPAGTTVASTRAAIPPGSRSFRTLLTTSAPLTAGDYTIRARVRLSGDVVPFTDSLTIALPAAPEPAGVLFVRRGAATGNRDMPTADARFRRNEQLRIEMPASAQLLTSARLLDRSGKPLAVPITAAATENPEGTRWHTAQVALAPLAPGDYLIEMTHGDPAALTRTLVGFRVVP